MKLICIIITIFTLFPCGRAQFDYSEYYGQQAANVGYQSLPQTNYLNNADLLPYLANNYNYNVPQCDCSCDKCYTTSEPCCIQFCSTCAQAGDQQSYVYVPYPYIVVNTPIPTTTTTTEATTMVAITTVTTTTVATTTTTVPPTTTTAQQATASEFIDTDTDTETYPLDPEDMLRGNYMKEMMQKPKTIKKNRNNKVMLTSLRRTKPRWMPKFGIVPIPDQLAEKLMLRIRNMKVLHPEKNTVRRIESIYPNDNINM